MKRYRSATALAVALLTAALWTLTPAVAANLDAMPSSDVTSSGPAVDLATYRSTSGRHKVRVESRGGEAAKIAVPLRRLDYGSFQVLEVDRATADRLLSAGDATSADGLNLVLLNVGAIDTTDASAAELGSKSLALSGGKQLHLVQFPGPIKPEWMTLLEATGAQVVTPIPSNAYLIYGDDRALNAVASLANTGVLQWQAAYLPQYKLQPGTEPPESATQLKSLVLKPPVGPTDLYQVQLVRDPVINALTETFLRDVAGSREPRSRYEILSYVNLVVQIPAALLAEAAKRPDVVSIARYIEPTRLDERQNMIMAGNLTGNVPNAGNYLTTLAGWGFTQTQFNTSGFVVDVTDDGADRNPGAADPGVIPQNANSAPFNPRHFLLYEGGSKAAATRFYFKSRWGTTSTTDAGLGLAGHGQLNMSIVGGFVPDSFDTTNARVHRDTQGFRYGLGVAPFVRMGNSVIFDPGYTDPAFPAMLSGGYASSTRISSNSWGADVAGAYNADSQAYDALVRDAQSGTAGNQQMIIVFSAGNKGPGAATIGSPGTGKNVITVGATENVRSHSEANGGNVSNTVGNDGCTVPDTGADSANDMATFSSRGPTSDGRRKPDIVAPGTHISGMSFVAASADALSPVNGLGAADAGFRADGVCGMPSKATVPDNKFFPVVPAQRWYTTSSGTSHSAPAAAGGAALIYQQFLNNPAYLSAHRTPAGSAAPSPALVKAYLANTARYMNGVGANDSLPSNNQGMGSVNLGTAFDGVQRIIRDQATTDRFTATGQSRTYFATVTSAAAPLRVTLAYTDAPGPTSGNAFINNLDLRVTVNGNTYLGNVFTGATSVTGGVADPRNNLESVFLPAGLPLGTALVIQVFASNISGQGDPTVVGNNQDYALVAYNATPAPDQALLSLVSTSLPTGNGLIEPNECNDLNVTLNNGGLISATAISTTLATSSAGVTIAQASSAYGNLAVGANGVNLTPYKISTSTSVVCGSIVNLTQTVNYTGGASPMSFPLSFTVGTPATAFSQSFDGVTAPALPAGWTTQQTGTTPPALWATTATGPDTGPNVAFTNGVASVATNSLISPPIPLPASPTGAVLNFRHAWSFEANTTNLFDGGILELSTDGGTTYNNVTSPAVGGSFTAGGYTGTIASADGNPLAGQTGWGRSQATFITSTLTLPTALNGQTIRFRWRAGWDSSVSAANPNWRIDTITLIAGYACGSGTGACIVPASSTTTVSSSLNPSTFGASVTLTAQVTGSTSPLPTGSATFFDGASTLGTTPLNGSASASFTTSALTVGSHNVTANYGGDANNTSSTGALTQVVNKANQTITGFTPTTPVVFGATAQTLTATPGASSSPLVFSRTSGPCTLTGASLSYTGAGSCVLAVNQAADGNYNAAVTVSATVVISKANQTITGFTPTTPVVFGAAAQTLTATPGASTSPLVFSVTSGPCALTGASLSYTGAGSCVVAVNQAADANYNAAVTVSATVVISKANQTITGFTPTTPVVFGVAAQTLTATPGASTSPLVFSVTSGPCALTGASLSYTGAGSCVVAVNQAADANYNAAVTVSATVVISKANQTITGFTPTTPVVFGAAAQTLTATPGASSSPLVFSLTSGPCALAGASLSYTGAGSCVVAVNQAADGNYNAAPTVSATVVVSKANQTITGFTPTTPVVFGAAAQTLTATPGASSSPLVFSVTSGPCALTGASLSYTGAGSCVLAVNQAADGNYNAAPTVSATVVVSKANQTITGFTPTTPVVFGAAAQTLSATPGASSSPLVFSRTSGPCTLTGASLSYTGAGSCVVAVNQAADANYNAAVTVSATVVISKANQTITGFTPTTPVVFGVAAQTLTATPGASTSPLVFSVTSGPCALTGASLSYTGAGSCVVAVNQAADGNYNAAVTVSATVVVNKANQLIVFGSVPTVVVGGTGTVSATGGGSGNAVTFASNTTSICTVAGATVTGVSAGGCTIAANQLGNGNYNAAAPQTQNFSITAPPPILDIDDSAPATPYDAASDGVLLIRYLLGYRGAELITGVISPAARRDATQVAAHIAANLTRFDVDGDGSTLATTDGVMILRRLLGITNSSVITQGAKNSSRSDADVVLAIDALRP